MMRMRAAAAAAVVGLFGLSAHAQTSFTETYTLTGQPGTQGLVAASSTPPPGLTFDDLVRGGAFTTGAARADSIATSVIAPNTGRTGNNAGFFQFGLTASAGDIINVTSGSLFYGATGNTNNIFTIEIVSSNDGFVSNIVSLGTQTFAPPQTGLANTIALTGTSNTGQLDFRVYASNSNNSASVLGLDTSVNLQGTFSPVPEPLTVGLVGAAGLGLVRLRRRVM